MTKKQIHTIELQEMKIEELTALNKALESGYLHSCKINAKLRKENDRLKKAENKLARVNT